MSFIQHKEFAVELKGVQKERTISDAFDQSASGQSLVDMNKLDMIVGSGGVLSHAPRRNQAARMLIDAFLPEGITELAVDSIFMMPQLGILSTIHEDAAIQVFEKDCLVRLGTCIAPYGIGSNNIVLNYNINVNDNVIKGDLKKGEIKVIRANYEECDVILEPTKGFNIGAGKNEILKTKIYGGEVGIILDGRGRNPFKISLNPDKRVQSLIEWSKSTDEYPNMESLNV